MARGRGDPSPNHMTKIADGAFTKGAPRQVENWYYAINKRGSVAVKQDQSPNILTFLKMFIKSKRLENEN